MIIVLIFIGLGALVGVSILASNLFRLVKKAQTSAIGLSLSRESASNLVARVNDIAERLNALPPNNVVVGLDPTFYVTEADVMCLDDTLHGRTLYCSLPLCRILSVSELDAIIGHELGHFKGLDTQFSEKFYPIYRGTATSIALLEDNEGAVKLALLPAITVLTFFFDAFSAAENTHSRTRELAADKEGASAASTESLASALVKVHAFAPFWSYFQDTTVAVLREGNVFVNASKYFAGVIQENADAGKLEGIADTHTSHPTDSHPPLAVRLQSLNMSLESVETSALKVNPDDPAIGLISNVEKFEEEISDAYQEILARNISMVDEQENESKEGS